MKFAWRRVVSASVLILPLWLRPETAEHMRRFGVRDDIALARFDDVKMSPQNTLLLVHTEHASLEDGMMHDKFRLYRLDSVRRAANSRDFSPRVDPVWSFEWRSMDPGGNADRISHVQWLADGKAFAFLFQMKPYRHRLYLAEVGSRRVVPLSRETDDVLGFDIRDASHYVFTIASHRAEQQIRSTQNATYRVGTGRSLEELAFPQDFSHFIQRGELWAVTGGKPKIVTDSTGKPIALFSEGNGSLSLSPDGTEVATLQAVPDVPEGWVRRYPPPYPDSPYGLKAHRQDLSAPYDGWTYVSEWVSIRLSDGKVKSLTDAPEAHSSGWWEVYTSKAIWSEDGATVVLPGTFSREESGKQDRPCTVAVHLKSDTSECIRPLKRQLANGFEEGWQSIDDIEFVPGRNDQILLKHDNGGTPDIASTIVYGRSGAGDWRVIGNRGGAGTDDDITIKVEQNYKCPPLLVATDTVTGRSLEILDPNPQLKTLALGAAEPYHWRDPAGRDWQGILYKPVTYVPGTRYPLVIQNHGFSFDRFVPSGGFPSAFVAEELASAGIMVLQVRDCAGRSSPLEGRCNVEGYESAVDQLSREGLVDSSRVGIIGFSRTVYYVLESLATSRLQFKAASITDGITLGYLDYLQCVGLPATFNDEKVAMIGAQPFGAGLAEWIQESPDFHLDKATTPLRVVATRGTGIVEMWEPYALLEAMHKPVDLIVLNTREHVLADPAMRLIAQTGNVDWFRFWLQDYEDPDPAKGQQYVRWRLLRDANNMN